MRLRAAVILLVVAALVAAVPAYAAPRMGKTVVVKPTRGTVLVKKRGSSSFARLRGTRTIPIGSALDTTAGRVRVTTARNSRGATQSGVFRDGVFTVQQGRRSALTELRLTGDDGCASGAGDGVRAAGRSRRRLFGNARGRFRTRGRQSSATVRGTVWITEDLCNGATLTTAVRGGAVDAKSQAASKRLKPGQSSEDYCNTEGFPGLTDLYCISLFSDPEFDVFGFAIATFEPGSLGNNPPAPPPREVDVCIGNPTGTERCFTYPLESIGEGFWLQSDGCTPADGPGTYAVRWRLGGTDLPVPLTYVSKKRFGEPGCVNRPPGAPPP